MPTRSKRKSRRKVQYTLRSIPPGLDQLLRARARHANKSLNEITLELLKSATQAEASYYVRNDLDEFIGTWEKDSETDAAFVSQNKIDPALWRRD